MGSTAAGSATGLTDYPLEREAVQRVLHSGIFDRAPNLALILKYVCERFFEGPLEAVREYNIAIDALGRPSDFDQKRDSIVRVEAHRLRKRLREYYEADGADHAIRIEIPPGQYAPQFLPSAPSLPSLSSETLVGKDGLAVQTPAAVPDPESDAADPVQDPAALIPAVVEVA